MMKYPVVPHGLKHLEEEMDNFVHSPEYVFQRKKEQLEAIIRFHRGSGDRHRVQLNEARRQLWDLKAQYRWVPFMNTLWRWFWKVFVTFAFASGIVAIIIVIVGRFN